MKLRVEIWNSCTEVEEHNLVSDIKRDISLTKIRRCLTSLNLEQLTTKMSKISTDINVLSFGPKTSNILGISDVISQRYIRETPRRKYARMLHTMAQLVLKINCAIS